MILLFTTITDYSVKEVCEYLYYCNAPFLRINRERFSCKLLSFNGTDYSVELNGNIINQDTKINGVWFRGGRISENYKLSTNFESNDYLKNYFEAYSLSKREVLKSIFSRYKTLGQNDVGRVNKINILNKAKISGLSVPEYIITSSKTDLVKFSDLHSRVICKSLDLNFFHSTQDKVYQSYTNILEIEHIENLPLHFELSYFQKYIKKEFEIRTFYLDGRFFSMAIFSQNDKGTSVDYRRYNKSKMNRCIRYNLPIELEQKLNSFFKSLNINTGSFDLIKSKEGQYIFLEINPIGQFGYLSGICNYNIEKEIADFLMR